MAGLLNLMPRYLPRYGMAPHWARAVRPMVIVFTLVAFLVTWIFDADVDAQGGAYATGVLVLISSAAVAVTIAARKAGQRNWTIAFAVISAVFLYTTVVNVIERPDGVKIGACFIAAHHPRLAPLPARPRLRTARHRRDHGRDGGAVRTGHREPPGPLHRQRARQPRHHRVPREDRADPRRQRHPRPGGLRLRRGHRPGRLGVRGGPDRTRRSHARPLPRPDPGVLLHPQRPRRPPPPRPRHHRPDAPTSTSSGPRATPSPTSSASSSSARARWPRSPARSSARPNPTAPAARTSTSASAVCATSTAAPLETACRNNR